MQIALPDRLATLDALRLGLRSAAAAAASAWLAAAINQPHVSWAVISALLVSQSTVDGTLAAVRGRLAGTLLGAVVGLAAVLLLPAEGMTLHRLVLAAAVVSLVSGLLPSLRYAAVVAAIICLEPGADPLRGALDRATAIGLGALVATLCAWLVWPQRAQRRVLRGARLALRDCADLLDLSLRTVLGERHAALDPLHRRYLGHIRAARGELAVVRKRGGDRQRFGRTVHAIERLWHALIVVDRVTSERSHWQAAPGSRAHEALQAVRLQACEQVRSLAQVMDGGKPSSESSLAVAVERAQAVVSEEAGASQLDAVALAFALGEIRDNLEEIRTCTAALASGRDGPAGGG